MLTTDCSISCRSKYEAQVFGIGAQKILVESDPGQASHFWEARDITHPARLTGPATASVHRIGVSGDCKPVTRHQDPNHLPGSLIGSNLKQCRLPRTRACRRKVMAQSAIQFIIVVAFCTLYCESRVPLSIPTTSAIMPCRK